MINIFMGSGIDCFREMRLAQNWARDAGFMFACMSGLPTHRFQRPKQINQVRAKWCLLSNQTPYIGTCGMRDSREKELGMRDQDPPSRPCLRNLVLARCTSP